MASRDTVSTTSDLSRHIETVAQLVGVKEITEGDAFTRMSKARHKSRLHDRWGCKTEGHTYCFTQAKANSLHLQLTGRDIDEWVDMIVILCSSPFQLIRQTKFQLL
jgi:hypothetical protein